MELGLSIEMADRDLGVIYRYFHEPPGRQSGEGNRRRQLGEGNQAEATRRDWSRLKLMVLQ